MLRLLNKNKKAQNTAEYALLIALVVAGIVAMQQYAQRALQARVRDAGTYMADQTGEIGKSVQYEPYYKKEEFAINKDAVENKRLGEGLVAQDSATTREKTGFTATEYDATATRGADNAVMPSGI